MLSDVHGPAKIPRGAQLIAALETLSGRVREHQETSKFQILPAWQVHRQLYEEKSPKLLFYDLETSWSTKPGTKYRWVFSIYMRDATRKTIIHTRISQGMRVNQLYDASDKPGWERDVRRWFGERSDELTPGMEWHQIADIMEKAGVSWECHPMEQSSGFFDHDNLYCNLREIGRHLLVPQRKNVLRLIPAMRLAFKGFSLNHSLSMMHFLLFPEDRYLIEHAHTEDADEEMLYKQAGLYFKGTRQKRKPSGIELYCTRGGKTQDNCVEEEGDDLLAPDELIKDMGDVLADVSAIILYATCTRLMDTLA